MSGRKLSLLHAPIRYRIAAAAVVAVALIATARRRVGLRPPHFTLSSQHLFDLY
jgi:hypothetical protein